MYTYNSIFGCALLMRSNNNYNFPTGWIKCYVMLIFEYRIQYNISTHTAMEYCRHKLCSLSLNLRRQHWLKVKLPKSQTQELDLQTKWDKKYSALENNHQLAEQCIFSCHHYCMFISSSHFSANTSSKSTRSKPFFKGVPSPLPRFLGVIFTPCWLI